MRSHHLEKRKLGRTGFDCTLLGFGALEIGRDWGFGADEIRRKPGDAEAALVLNRALDMGINLIDTARAYHRSEERIGASIAQRRGEYFLATKCGEHSDEPRTYYDFSYDAITRSIDLSRSLLQTDVIDLIQIHFGPDPAKVLDDGETVRAMRDAREAGKVRWLGASPGNELLDRCIESSDFDVLQVGFSLLHQDAAPLIQKAGDRGIGVLIRSGLAMGWLTGRALTVPRSEWPKAVSKLMELVNGDSVMLQRLALAYLKSQPGISSILVGTKDIAHLEQNAALLADEVDPAMLERSARIARNA